LKKPIALEVNGVFHYPRNSTKELGKEAIKKRVLEELEGYKNLTIPYSDWYILENDKKKGYLSDCIQLVSEFQ